jgi:hypothetical protein
MNPNLKEPVYLRKGRVIKTVYSGNEHDYKSISLAKKESRRLQGDKSGDGTVRVIRD